VLPCRWCPFRLLRVGSRFSETQDYRKTGGGRNETSHHLCWLVYLYFRRAPAYTGCLCPLKGLSTDAPPCRSHVEYRSRVRAVVSSKPSTLRLHVFAQKGGRSDGTQRRSEEVTLAKVTTQGDKPTELLIGLDAFGDGDESQLMC
jgi:hypothetical protein